MKMSNQLQVNGDRLWRDLMSSAVIGRGRTTGLRRLALTDSDKEMRDLFVQWCESAGCAVTVDKVCNIFARRAGNEDLAPVMIGSHLDTQIAGGKYDGILGVLSGLEVVRTLNDHQISTRRPLEVVCWTNEEGARFQPPMMCSGAFAGVHDLDWVLSQIDDDGVSFGDELRRIGYDGAADVGGRPIDSYFELHIEQGPDLEAEAVDVGIVTGGFTSYGMHVEIRGENAHSGPTPMDRRRNALVGAAMLIVGVNEIGWSFHPEGRSTCSRIKVWPNKYGILPDFSEVTCDVRHSDAGRALEMFEAMKALVPEACERARVSAQVVKEWSFGDIRFDKDCINIVETAAHDLGVSHRRMLSIAGHDAYHIAGIAPTALIFTPCKDGISHNEAEHIELSYTLPGVNVLLHSVLARANG